MMKFPLSVHDNFQVDNYETQEYQFNIRESADAQFNNIQYMYVGRNDSMAEGFVGCVSRVEFDDIYPLKLLFQQDPPPNVRSIGGERALDYTHVQIVICDVTKLCLSEHYNMYPAWIVFSWN